MTQAASASLPRPPALPLIGALPTLLRQQFTALDRWQRELGGIFEVPLGPNSFVFITSPEIAGEMLIDKGRNFVRGGPAWESLSTVFGDGIIASEGERWRDMRRAFQPYFHVDALRNLTIAMAESVDEVCALWKDQIKSQPEFNLEHKISQLTMAVILRVMLGVRISDQWYERASESLQLAIDRVALGWLTSKLPRWVPLPGRARYREALLDIDRMVAEFAEQRRTSRRFDDDVLGMLVMLLEQGRLDTVGLRDQTVSIFIAGYETTANTLGFTLWELASRPELLARVRDEADRVLGPADGPPVGDFDRIMSLELCTQVFREGLRMYPGAIWLPRFALTDDTLGGMSIPAGTTTVVSVYNVQNDPELWDSPREFRPERFAEGAEPLRHRHAWMPFGLGQHMCIGQRLALAEGTLAIARLAQRFDFEPLAGRAPRMKMSTALTTYDGIWVRMRSR